MISKGAADQEFSQERPSGQSEVREELSQNPWLGKVLEWHDADTDRHIREWVSIDPATHLQSLLDLNNEEVIQLLLGRYRNDRPGLQGAEAERTVRLAGILTLAADTVGSIEEEIV